MEKETFVERIIEKKIVKPPPPTAQLVSMIRRFKSCKTKEEMIEKFNLPQNGPSWTPYEKRVALNAMTLLLKGEAPNIEKARTAMDDLDEDITLELLKKKPKSEIELKLEAELAETKSKLAQYENDAPEKEPFLDDVKEEAPIPEEEELPISEVNVVERPVMVTEMKKRVYNRKPKK